MSPSGPEAIVEQLRDRIRDGSLPPGTPLNQVQLADDLGVSRIPLREALRSLSSEGLVVLQPGQSARVVEHSRRDIIDLYDLRLRLEPPLATEIIDSLPPAEIRTLRSLAQAMCATSAPQAWSDLNHRFHQAMYGPVDRPHTVRIVLQIVTLTEPYSHRYVHLLAGIDQASQEHLAMVDAIQQRDSDRLESLIRAHLQGARDALLDALERV